MSLVWRVAKRNITQETPNNNNETNNRNYNKKQLRDAGAGFNLKDHGAIGSDFSTVNKISILNWFIHPNTVKNHIYLNIFSFICKYIAFHYL